MKKMAVQKSQRSKRKVKLRLRNNRYLNSNSANNLLLGKSRVTIKIKRFTFLQLF